MPRLVSLIIALLIAAVSCSSDSAGTEFTVTYDGATCVYDGPDSLKAGTITETFVNDSDDDVGIDFRRLNDDVSY